MSTFEVKVVKIDEIIPIDGADAIELARIADFRSVVKKGDFKAGDLAVYIPEASIIPEWLLKTMGLEGKLAGSNKNRLKAVKLRGVLSQGLLYSVHSDHGPGPHIHLENGFDLVWENKDVAEFLGITKYQPIIPDSMRGEVCNIGQENVIKFDIENLKKYPNIIQEGEEVIATEKLHGSFCGIGFIPNLNHPDLFYGGDIFTFSKGLGAQGLVFKNNKNNENNLYVKNLLKIVDTFYEQLNRSQLDMTKPVYILGEVFGGSVQDLKYGLSTPEFRVFDIYTGKPGQGRYLNWNEMQEVLEVTDLQSVDLLYKGPFNKNKIEEVTSGKTITGKGQNIREGVVIKPLKEKIDKEIGRVILKNISPDYLIRKGDVTEYT